MSSTTSDAKPFGAILALLVFQGALLVWLCLGAEHAQARGVAHPRLPAMRAAPLGAERLDAQALPLALYGVGIVLGLIALLGLGFRDGKGKLLAPRAFALASLALLASFAWMWIARADGPAHYGLPGGTFALLFGIWPAEALFVLVFVLWFRRGYWTPESEARFEALLAERRRREEGEE